MDDRRASSSRASNDGRANAMDDRRASSSRAPNDGRANAMHDRGTSPSSSHASNDGRANAMHDRGASSSLSRASDDGRAVPSPKVARAARQNTRLDGAPLTCPRCNTGHLMTGSRGWGCDRWREGCRFVVWFETAGRRLTPAQLRALITQGKTRKATFLDPAGKPIEARLVLDLASATGARVELA
jgi:DNA topoisomerase-3